MNEYARAARIINSAISETGEASPQALQAEEERLRRNHDIRSIRLFLNGVRAE